MSMRPSARHRRSAAMIVVLAASLAGCATTPAPAPPPRGDVMAPPGSLVVPVPTPRSSAASSGSTNHTGSEIVIRAISLLGAPYRYGASGPTAFDCSGLVQFVHEELGIDVPRTAAEQYKAAEPVKLEELEPGDLLFFRISGKRISHVAIYAGSGRFVHAPQTGRPIELRPLDDDYYRRRLAGAGRLF